MVTKPIRRAFKILIVSGIVVALLLLLAQDQQTLTVRSAVSAEDARHPAYLSALVGAALSEGNRYVVHANGDQIFPAMLDAVRKARRRISFESYIYNSEAAIAREFTRAFEEAARRGVTVNLVLDAVGAQSLSADDLTRLREAGCTVALFNAPTWYSLEELNYRTHRKILVVDGEVGFTGGAGIDDQWKGNARNRDEWRDAYFTGIASVMSPSTMMRTRTPRPTASCSDQSVDSSGTKYGVEMSSDRVADAIANRYSRLRSLLPPVGELLTRNEAPSTPRPGT